MLRWHFWQLRKRPGVKANITLISGESAASRADAQPASSARTANYSILHRQPRRRLLARCSQPP